VLKNNDFTDIVQAVEQGRVIYANLQAFISFLLSTNASEILFIVTMIVVGLPAPLQALQILLINLVCDGLPALALSREKAEDGVMRRPPRPTNENIIHGYMWAGILANSFALLCSVFTVFLLGLHWHAGGLEEQTSEEGVEIARTMTFICVTLSEYMRAYGVRSQRRSVISTKLFSNWTLQICIFVSASVLAPILFIPALMDIWGFRYIGGREWALCAGCALFPLFITEIVKIWVRSLPQEVVLEDDTPQLSEKEFNIKRTVTRNIAALNAQANAGAASTTASAGSVIAMTEAKAQSFNPALSASNNSVASSSFDAPISQAVNNAQAAAAPAMTAAQAEAADAGFSVMPKYAHFNWVADTQHIQESTPQHVNLGWE
jgi:hypothetical protein